MLFFWHQWPIMSLIKFPRDFKVFKLLGSKILSKFAIEVAPLKLHHRICTIEFAPSKCGLCEVFFKDDQGNYAASLSSHFRQCRVIGGENESVLTCNFVSDLEVNLNEWYFTAVGVWTSRSSFFWSCRFCLPIFLGILIIPAMNKCPALSFFCKVISKFFDRIFLFLN